MIRKNVCQLCVLTGLPCLFLATFCQELIDSEGRGLRGEKLVDSIVESSSAKMFLITAQIYDEWYSFLLYLMIMVFRTGLGA